eukprot:1156056-Pelagomonas_calceolata.AAC.9
MNFLKLAVFERFKIEWGSLQNAAALHFRWQTRQGNHRMTSASPEYIEAKLKKTLKVSEPNIAISPEIGISIIKRFEPSSVQELLAGL